MLIERDGRKWLRTEDGTLALLRRRGEYSVDNWLLPTARSALEEVAAGTDRCDLLAASAR